MTPEPACFEWLRLQTTWIRNILFWIRIQPTTSLILIKKLLDPDPHSEDNLIRIRKDWMRIHSPDPKLKKRPKFHLYVHSFRH